MKKQTFIRILSLVLALVSVIPFITSCKNNKKTQTTATTATTVTKPYNPNDFLYSGEKVELYSDKVKPVIYVDANDYKQSVRAVKDLQKDFERVTGTKPAIVTDEKDLSGAGVAIIIGTLGKSSFVTSLENDGRIGLDSIKDKWEAYNISVVENLTDNVKKAVVIAGSDKRGTVYGTYELSELIGVSPWYFWGDVEIEHADTIELPIEKLTQTEMPDVKYRGIFINDEENFTAWSTHFTDKNSPGKPNPNTYKLVFELLLRLKANTLWPAMHDDSDAFYKYKNPKTGISYNAELADDYGVVMSASHCEMLQRNNVDEWGSWCEANKNKYNLKKVSSDSWGSSYDYTVNAEAMNAYWEERVAECYRFENIFMIGLRGVHDSGINCSQLSDKSYKGKATVVKKAVEAQLEILEKYEKLLSEERGEEVKFTTAYCVYKEAAEYFKHGIGLPSDCCLMYAEDNHGYVRSMASEADKKKYESFGMYYHVSYRGSPESYLWLSNTPLATIAEEMRRCYYTGTTEMWILNVGDIKPAEFKTEYFLDMGWDIEAHTEHNTEEFSAEFLKQNFSLDETTSKNFASTLTEFYQLMRSLYPEIIDKHEDTGNYPLSVTEYGGEGFIFIDKLTKIYNKSLAIYNSLPEGKKDSFYELFHYTVYSYLLIVEKHVYAQMNNICYDQKRFAAANIYADLSENAHAKVLLEVEYFNTIQDGKWEYIMDPYNPSVVRLPAGAPSVKRASVAYTAKGVSMAAEGQRYLTESAELVFGSLNNDVRFVDIFNKGDSADTWAMSAPSYVIVTNDGKVLSGNENGENVVYTGSVEIQDRLHLSIDWERFAKGETKNSELILTDSYGNNVTVKIKATKHALDPASESTKGYYEENGLVSIQAEHYSENIEKSGFKWTYIDGLGRSGGVMMALSTSQAKGYVNTRLTGDIAQNSPYVEYKIHFTNPGTYYGTFYRLPTLNESATEKSYCQSAWSLDSGALKTLNGTTTADTSTTSSWANMIKLHIEELAMTMEIKEAGWHTLRVYMVNSLQAFDAIVLNQSKDALKSSRYNAPETFNTLSDWERAPIADLEAYTFEQVKWGAFSKLLDMTSGDAQSAYEKVTASKGDLATLGWDWENTETLKGYYKTSASKSHTLDNGFVSGSSDNTFKIQAPAPGKYTLTISIGDPTGGIKAQNMSIKNAGVTLLEGISTGSEVIRRYAEVTADENGVIRLELSGTWMLSAVEVYGYTEKKASGSTSFTANQNGDIVIDVEHCLENSEYASVIGSNDVKNMRWEQVAGIYGSAMFFGPNKGSTYSNTNTEACKSSKMFFTVSFEKAGRYKMMGLVKAAGDNDDSILISLGTSTSTAVNNFKNTEGYIWVDFGEYTVSKTGEITLTLSGREDGLTLDRVIIYAADETPVLDGECVRK